MGNANIEGKLKVDGKLEAFGVIPIGGVIPYFGTNTPKGWLFCDGSVFDTTFYPELYSVLGSNTLPKISDNRYLEGASIPNVPQDASIPNIKGEVTIKGIDSSRLYIDHTENQIVQGANNALSGGNSACCMRVASYKENTAYKQHKTLVFDANKYNNVYNDTNILRPKSVTVRYLIRAK